MYSQLNEETYKKLKDTVKALKAEAGHASGKEELQKKTIEADSFSTAKSHDLDFIDDKTTESNQPDAVSITSSDSKQSHQSSTTLSKSDQKISTDSILVGSTINSRELDLSSMLHEIKSELERYKTGCSGRTPQMDLHKLHTQDDVITKLMDLKSCTRPFESIHSTSSTNLKKPSSAKTLEFNMTSFGNPLESIQESSKTPVLNYRSPLTSIKELKHDETLIEFLPKKSPSKSFPKSVLKVTSMTKSTKQKSSGNTYDSYSPSSSSSSSGKYTKKTSKKKHKKKRYSSTETTESVVSELTHKSAHMLNNPHQFIMNSTPSQPGHTPIKIFDRERYSGVARSQERKNKRNLKSKKHKKQKKYHEA